jgi:hypothetical protein
LKRKESEFDEPQKEKENGEQKKEKKRCEICV